MTKNSNTHTDWEVAKTKLNALRELCIEDDLLDLQAFDSIERANKIQRAWDALDVIKNIDKLLADARKEVFTKEEKDYMIALLTIVQTEIETDRALGMRVDNRGEKMCNNILTILRG